MCSTVEMLEQLVREVGEDVAEERMSKYLATTKRHTLNSIPFGGY